MSNTFSPFSVVAATAALFTLTPIALPEIHVGRNAANQLAVEIGFAQPFPLAPSIFPNISGFATGEQGFHSVHDHDEGGGGLLDLSHHADIRAILVSVDTGANLYNGLQPMQIGEEMTFGELPFDYHPIFQIVAGGAVPGQVRNIGLRFRDASGHHTESDVVLIAFTPAGCPADIGRQGGLPGSDGLLNNNDFIIFINEFFAMHAAADVGVQGGGWGSDGLFDNNDFVSYITLFFAGGVCG